MRPFRVEHIMSEDPLMIQEGRTGEDALNKMKQKGKGKIIVIAKDGTPKGVLELWKITKFHLDKLVENLELSPIKNVPLGTELSTIKEDLLDYPAICVSDPMNPKIIRGVITSSDILKSY